MSLHICGVNVLSVPLDVFVWGILTSLSLYPDFSTSLLPVPECVLVSELDASHLAKEPLVSIMQSLCPPGAAAPTGPKSEIINLSPKPRNSIALAHGCP